MTARHSLHPPRLGMAILGRLSDRNEALAGDIVEGFHVRRSSLWFWRELAGAIFSGAFRRTETRPLKLVEFPSMRPLREDFAAKRLRLQTLGLSASPVQNVSGWTIVGMVYLITALQPVLWVLMGLAAIFGVAIGLVRVARRRRLGPAPGAELTTLVLFNHHTR